MTRIDQADLIAAGLKPLEAPSLARLQGVRHGFFTRSGGVSEGLYHSLNVGMGSDDAPALITENRRRVAAWFDAAPDRLLTCHQVHSAIVVHAADPWSRPEADGVVAACAGPVCAVLSADCAPVLLADEEARVVGAVHAGWRGALCGAVEAAVLAMIGAGASAKRIQAAVGPCIGPRSYEVGEEFLARFSSQDPGSERFFSSASLPGKHLFDLPAYVVARLDRAGVGSAEWIARDTFAEEALFFSHRRSVHQGLKDYGRLIAAVTLD
jgi:YfiH family protein